MKNSFKKMGCMLTALTLIGALSACGENKEKNTNPEKTQATEKAQKVEIPEKIEYGKDTWENSVNGYLQAVARLDMLEALEYTSGSFAMSEYHSSRHMDVENLFEHFCAENAFNISEEKRDDLAPFAEALKARIYNDAKWEIVNVEEDNEFTPTVIVEYKLTKFNFESDEPAKKLDEIFGGHNEEDFMESEDEDLRFEFAKEMFRCLTDYCDTIEEEGKLEFECWDNEWVLVERLD